MRPETVKAFEDLLIGGNLNEIEQDLLDMYDATLCSQQYLGQLTDSCLSSYLHTIRGVVKALRLVEAENQFNLVKAS